MKLLIISPSESSESEHIIIRNMIDIGLTSVHIRKPNLSTEGLKKYLSNFPEEYHLKMIIHAHHNLMWDFNLKGLHYTKAHKKRTYRNWFQERLFKLKHKHPVKTTSCNSISSLADSYNKFEYLMLTPVFSNKQEHRPIFSRSTLDTILHKYPDKVVARGGATLDSIEKAKEIGFSGIAFHHGVWRTSNPLKTFQDIHARYKDLGITIDSN